MRYLLYARVSPKGSDWSANETSIQQQLDDMRAAILRDDHSAVFHEVTDEFYSGRNTNRPGMQTILAEINSPSRPWDCLAVWNLDRLSRSINDALPIFKLLRDKDCSFISVNQPYLSSHGAMSRFVLHQTIAIAELERDMTSERVSAKLRNMAERGEYPSGVIPFGYSRIDKTHIAPNEDADMVRYIFKAFIDGKLSYADVCEKYPGKAKNRQFLYNILRKRIYTGVLPWAGREYPVCEGIVSDEDFGRVQALLAGNRRNYARQSAKYEYLLTGMVECSCGRAMTPYSVRKPNGTRYHYYKCTSPDCRNAVNAENLESAVLDEVAKVYESPDEIEASINEYLHDVNVRIATKRNRINQLKESVEECGRKISNLISAMENGLVALCNQRLINDRIDALNREKSDAEREICELGKPEPDFDTREYMDALMYAAREWADGIRNGTASYAVKRNLVLSTVRRVILTKKETESCEFRLELVMSNSQKWRAGEELVITRFFRVLPRASALPAVSRAGCRFSG